MSDQPKKTENEELSDEQLEGVSGGTAHEDWVNVSAVEVKKTVKKETTESESSDDS